MRAAPQHAHAVTDVLWCEVFEAHVADHIGAGLDSAGAGAVCGRLDAGLVISQPTFRIVDQIWTLAAR